VLAVVLRRTVTPTHRVGAHMSALAEVA
jgi:hypothetical protein